MGTHFSTEIGVVAPIVTVGSVVVASHCRSRVRSDWRLRKPQLVEPPPPDPRTRQASASHGASSRLSELADLVTRLVHEFPDLRVSVAFAARRNVLPIAGCRPLAPLTLLCPGARSHCT
jgi:hypothetical protein